MSRVIFLSVLLFACSNRSPSAPPEVAPSEQATTEQAPAATPTPADDTPAAPEAEPAAPESDPAPAEGEPASADAAPKADGEACLVASECSSGICEGQGCSDDAPGVCAPATRGCTRDLKTYCGCDGEIFRTSGSCPGQRYEKLGPC